MKKQTAVEWLMEQLGVNEIVGTDYSGLIRIFAEAKEMFEQQIVDAFEQGEYTGRGFEDVTSEEYYNINFKSE
jgi:hypothetical protein